MKPSLDVVLLALWLAATAAAGFPLGAVVVAVVLAVASAVLGFFRERHAAMEAARKELGPLMERVNVLTKDVEETVNRVKTLELRVGGFAPGGKR